MVLVPRGWNELGVCNIIYEEEDDDDSSTIPSLSPDSTASSTPENRRVEAWLLATCREPDVIIHVQDSCFRLHKDRLIARSGYLEQQLKEFSKATFSLPLNIMAETFSLVTNFCYGAHISVTPFNVASLLIAAKLLDMSETRGLRDDNLCQKTENYFRLVVTVNLECVSIVLRSCFSLLPEVETTACLVSRCIEALSLMGDVEAVTGCLHDVKKICFEDFQLILKSTSQRLIECHDLLYIIVDLYLKEHNFKMTEDQKTEMCIYVDCSTLSSKVLIHAIQNPRMPLRFVVHVMFVGQLNARSSIISAVDHQDHKHQTEDPVTLG